jgi:hypothetical protein
MFKLGPSSADSHIYSEQQKNKYKAISGFSSLPDNQRETQNNFTLMLSDDER